VKLAGLDKASLEVSMQYLSQIMKVIGKYSSKNSAGICQIFVPDYEGNGQVLNPNYYRYSICQLFVPYHEGICQVFIPDYEGIFQVFTSDYEGIFQVFITNITDYEGICQIFIQIMKESFKYLSQNMKESVK
jgi:hypothetical protein